jgi:transglutaminase-like putative cysteine protease
VTADRREEAIAVVAFAALGGFCAFHWANLLIDPPVGRLIAVVAIAVASGVALGRLAGSRLPRPVVAGCAALVVVAGIGAGMVAAGLEARLLAPWNWDELGHGIADGIVGVGGATYPYRAGGDWERLVLLAAIPLALGVAAALAFWPLWRRAFLRAAGLAVLLGLYAMAVVLYAPGNTALHGVVLLALVAIWLWAPRAGERRGAVAVALVAGAGVLALPLSSAIARSEPVVDYRSWSWTGGEPAVSFDWNHSYDLLDWPREGTPLLEIESEVPHYWRSIVLERFDGFRWVRSDGAGVSLELPSKVEGAYSPRHEEWLESTTVTVRELRSGLVVGPGSPQSVEGLTGAIAGDGTVLAGEIPESGQRYVVNSYAPDPSADEMRAATDPYPGSLTRFTTLEMPSVPPGLEDLDLPQLEGANGVPPTTEAVTMPLRGGIVAARSAQRSVEAAGYGPVLRLAERLTADAPTGYDAVLAVERHFQEGFTYSEEAASGTRPLRSFLFGNRTGYCQQYSGAMALLLRMAGIPVRVVSGFSPGAPDLGEDGVFTVRDTDAHSWVEVYFTGIGWVPFDPTPSVSPAELQSAPTAAAATPGRSPETPNGRAREPEAVGGVLGGARDGSGGGLPLLVPVALLAATGLGAAAATARRRARFDAATRPARLDAQVSELAGALEAASYGVGGGATLLDLERRLRDGGRAAAAAYVKALRACLYARVPGAQPGLHERRAARRELGRARGIRERLRLLAAMPPGGPRLPSSSRG